MIESNLETVKEENFVECRACLQEIYSFSNFYNLFDFLDQQMGSTIAESISDIAHVQITESDELPKVICDICYTLLQSAYSFATTVRKTDQLLRQKFNHGQCGSNSNCTQRESEKEWPKPIQISNIQSTFPHVEIKEEVIEEECVINHTSSDAHISHLDIKIEPNTQNDCEVDRPKINGVCSLNDMDAEYLDSPASSEIEPQTLENTAVKEEPMSEEETDLVESLECMLCTKKFQSISGLKAHVITQHSYKSVKRKSDDTDSPEKVEHTYICEICRRAFATSTDLMVHETCHNKSKCYMCNKNFSTFAELSQHRLTCCEITNTTTTVSKPNYTTSIPKQNIEKSKKLKNIRESQPKSNQKIPINTQALTINSDTSKKVTTELPKELSKPEFNTILQLNNSAESSRSTNLTVSPRLDDTDTPELSNTKESPNQLEIERNALKIVPKKRKVTGHEISQNQGIETEVKRKEFSMYVVTKEPLNIAYDDNPEEQSKVMKKWKEYCNNYRNMKNNIGRYVTNTVLNDKRPGRPATCSSQIPTPEVTEIKK